MTYDQTLNGRTKGTEEERRVSPSEERRARLLAKMGRLYYIDGLSQQEIAEKLGLSRPHVSRLLTLARSQGIVEIRIHSPYPEVDRLAADLEDRFGLRDAIVVPDTEDAGTPLSAVARAAGQLLDETLPAGATVAVSAGATANAVAHAIEHPKPRSSHFVPMVGGQGPVGASWHANETVRLLAIKFRGEYFLLNAPAVVANPSSRDTFLAEPEIARVLERAAASQVALVGVGGVAVGSNLVKSGGLTEAEMARTAEQGAVGNVNTEFIDLDGEVVKTSLSGRFVGLTTEQLKAIPYRIAVVTGEDKAPAILGALRGGFFSALVTGAGTARAVLALDDRTRPKEANAAGRR